MNMVYLSSVFATLTIILLFNGLQTTNAKRNAPKRINMDGCTCQNLQCDCCSSVRFKKNYEVCLIIQAIPNELTLRGTIKVNGRNIFTRQLGPSTAPICVGGFRRLSTLCVSINHVDIQRRQVCAKVNLLLVTVVRFPCVYLKNGRLYLESNNYP